MKKTLYESPLCETVKLLPESTLLVGSPGAAGDDLNELDPLNLATSPFDALF